MTEYQARRSRMTDHLGGKCVKCGVMEDLQFDHVDPRTKSFDVSKNWARSWAALVEELNKCQLLCGDHHREKTLTNREHAGGHNKWTDIKHGKVWAYTHYRCRCDECKAAKSAARKVQHLRDVGKSGNPPALGA